MGPSRKYYAMVGAARRLGIHANLGLLKIGAAVAKALDVPVGHDKAAIYEMCQRYLDRESAVVTIHTGGPVVDHVWIQHQAYKARHKQQLAEKRARKREKRNSLRIRRQLARENLTRYTAQTPTAINGRATPVPYAEYAAESAAFLASYEWRKLRMIVLKKCGSRCGCCGASPRDGRVIHVDHIKPRRKYPELALVESNLQVLCDICNHGKGNWDETDWRPI